MGNTVLLNSVDHKNLKIRQQYGVEVGANVNQVLIFSTEFGDIQKEYPILFFKNKETKKFQAVALLGLDRDENLFLFDGEWRADYVPALFARGPFSIAMAERNLADGTKIDLSIRIDMEDPRVNFDEGHPVFLPHGGSSPYLNKINSVLSTIYKGLEHNDSMFSAFESADLLEETKLEISISETEQFIVSDYYTISSRRLAGLSASALERLNKAGFLTAAVFAMNSVTNISRLIDKKNSRRAEYRPS